MSTFTKFIVRLAMCVMLTASAGFAGEQFVSTVDHPVPDQLSYEGQHVYTVNDAMPKAWEQKIEDYLTKVQSDTGVHYIAVFCGGKGMTAEMCQRLHDRGFRLWANSFRVTDHKTVLLTFVNRPVGGKSWSAHQLSPNLCVSVSNVSARLRAEFGDELDSLAKVTPLDVATSFVVSVERVLGKRPMLVLAGQ